VQSETDDFAPAAATWRTGRNIRVVFDSGLFPSLYWTSRHPRNRKYITYRIVALSLEEDRAMVTGNMYRQELSKCWGRPGPITVNSEDTISWATFSIVCGNRSTGISTQALEPGVPRPSGSIGDRVSIAPSVLYPVAKNSVKFGWGLWHIAHGRQTNRQTNKHTRHATYRGRSN